MKSLITHTVRGFQGLCTDGVIAGMLNESRIVDVKLRPWSLRTSSMQSIDSVCDVMYAGGMFKKQLQEFSEIHPQWFRH